MRREEDADGNALIFCVNHACKSNGGSNADAMIHHKLNIRDHIGRNEGDWPTENDENGNYSISCQCGRQCVGPKRAAWCYICEQESKRRWNALTPEQQTQELIETGKLIKEYMDARRELFELASKIL